MQTNRYFTIVYLYFHLTGKIQPILRQLNFQCLFINTLQKTWSKFFVNFNRRANYLITQLFELIFCSFRVFVLSRFRDYFL